MTVGHASQALLNCLGAGVTTFSVPQNERIITSSTPSTRLTRSRPPARAFPAEALYDSSHSSCSSTSSHRSAAAGAVCGWIGFGSQQLVRESLKRRQTQPSWSRHLRPVSLHGTFRAASTSREVIAEKQPSFSAHVLVASICLAMVLLNRVALRTLRPTLPSVRFVVIIHTLFFLILSLFSRSRRQGKPQYMLAIAVAAFECASWAALQKVALVNGLGTVAALLSGVVLVYTMTVSNLFSNRKHRLIQWLGAVLVAVGVFTSGPSVPQLSKITGVGLVLAASIFSGLGLVGKQMLLDGEQVDGQWKRRPLTVPTVACMSSAAQLVSIILVQASSLSSTSRNWTTVLIGTAPKLSDFSTTAITFILASALLRLGLAWALRASSASTVQLVNALAVPVGAATLTFLEQRSTFSNDLLVPLLLPVFGSCLYFIGSRPRIVKEISTQVQEVSTKVQEFSATVQVTPQLKEVFSTHVQEVSTQVLEEETSKPEEDSRLPEKEVADEPEELAREETEKEKQKKKEQARMERLSFKWQIEDEMKNETEADIIKEELLEREQQLAKEKEQQEEAKAAAQKAEEKRLQMEQETQREMEEQKRLQEQKKQQQLEEENQQRLEQEKKLEIEEQEKLQQLEMEQQKQPPADNQDVPDRFEKLRRFLLGFRKDG